MITVDVSNRPVLDYLERLQKRFADLSPVMASIGMELESRISERFETGTDPTGADWAPWAPSTVEHYPEDGNRRLLDRYSDMLGSLNHQAGADSVAIGFGQPYAAYHEFGTRRMPRRGLLFEDPDTGTLADDDEQAVLDLLEDWLAGVVEG